MKRTLLTLLSITVLSAAISQTSGTITIGKSDTSGTDSIVAKNTTSSTPSKAPLRHINGLFYSDWVSDQIRVGNSITYKQTRYYFYVTSQGSAYFFRSVGKPKKVMKILLKEPTKLAEEAGKYELNDGILYIETGSISDNKVFRYSGEANATKIWIDVKSEYRKKLELDLMFNKFIE
ncbi:MAG: hypothetical protein ACI9J3_000371 [Parvicellaceae bacterium]|jgi:hypothetical protein